MLVKVIYLHFSSANCNKTKRKVTIKAIGTSNKEISKIAYRELKTMKFVEHKNIIRLVDMFYRERLYLVSEMMDDNLNDLIRTKRFEEEKVKSLIYQIINGLNYLHSIGIIHMVWIGNILKDSTFNAVFLFVGS